MIVWITGRPASGKTTLAKRIVSLLQARGERASLVDSDEVRAIITPTARYLPDERRMVYRAIAYVARRLADEGIHAIVAATAHDHELRDAARAIVPDARWILADCPLDVARARDPKRLYAAAATSAENQLPGIGVPFEPPRFSHVVIDTTTSLPDADLLARVEAAPIAGPPVADRST